MSGRSCRSTSTLPAFALMIAGLLSTPTRAPADILTFSGTVTYLGTHTGDTLYVAVLDTTGVEDVTLLAIDGFAVGPPPFSQGYSFDFDNTGVGPLLFVASFLDVDGGGVQGLNGTDVFGWFEEGSAPTGIPSTASHAGLDFALPRAEIHGSINFAVGQAEAWVDVSNDASCATEGFRPRHYQTSAGPYSINGLYPGTYCVVGGGYVPMRSNLRICYGDPLCANPTLITLSETEVRNGVDLDFTHAVPAQRTTWGSLKSRYP